MTATTDDKWLRKLCARAGVTANEMRQHPEHGLMLTASAVRKLAEAAPDQDAAKEVLNMMAQMQRSALRVVPGGKA